MKYLKLHYVCNYVKLYIAVTMLPETVTTVSRMVTIISRSHHDVTEFSKAKEVGIT